MSDLNLTEELKKQIKEQLKKELEAEIKAELREELKKELMGNTVSSNEPKLEASNSGLVYQTIESKDEESDAASVSDNNLESNSENNSEVAEPAQEAKNDTATEPASEMKSETAAEPASEIKSEAGAESTSEIKNETDAESISEIKSETAAEVEEKIEEKAEEKTDLSQKKKITFGKALIIYAVIWLVITFGVSIYLYNAMAGYQRNYDEAKRVADPDLVADSVIELFNKENIRQTAGDAFSQVSIYESDEAWNEYLSSAYDENSLSYNRVEKFSETNPEYQVVAGNTIIGSFKLTETGDANKYGFHSYELKSTEVSLALPELTEYKVTVLNGQPVYVNGKDITISENAVVSTVSDSVHDVAVEKSNKSFEAATYTISGFFKEPKVEAANVTLALDADDANEFSYFATYDEKFMGEISERVLTAGENYIKVMNMATGFNNIALFLVNNGNAYKAIQSAMSGLSWAGAPEEFNIKNSEIKELWQYDDSTFVVITHHETHRVYRGETYDEEMTIECLYTYYGGNWFIQEMALKR